MQAGARRKKCFNEAGALVALLAGASRLVLANFNKKWLQQLINSTIPTKLTPTSLDRLSSLYDYQKLAFCGRAGNHVNYSQPTKLSSERRPEHT